MNSAVLLIDKRRTDLLNSTIKWAANCVNIHCKILITLFGVGEGGGGGIVGSTVSKYVPAALLKYFIVLFEISECCEDAVMYTFVNSTCRNVFWKTVQILI